MILNHKGLIEVQPADPSAIRVDRDLAVTPIGALIATNALLLWKLGGRVQFTEAELSRLLDLGRTLVQENVHSRTAGRVIQLSLLTNPPPPHRDSVQPPKGQS
jgi:hypothetical protein